MVTMKPHQLKRLRSHVADEIAGTDAVVVLGNYFQAAYIGNLIGSDNYRTEAEERIDALRSGQIARVLAQDIERGQIQRRGVTENYILNMLRRHESTCFADDHAQFALGVNVVGDFQRRQ